MKFLGFTTHENGKPLLIREDLVGDWQFHRGHGLLLVLGQDMTDIEIKEGPEEFLAIVKGNGNGIQGKQGKPVVSRSDGDVPEVPPGRQGKRRGGGRYSPARVPRGDGERPAGTVAVVDRDARAERGTQGTPGGGGEPAPVDPHGVDGLHGVHRLPPQDEKRETSQGEATSGTLP